MGTENVTPVTIYDGARDELRPVTQADIDNMRMLLECGNLVCRIMHATVSPHERTVLDEHARLQAILSFIEAQQH